MRRTYWIFALCLLGISSSLLAQRQVIDKVAAMVGGEIVLLSEVEEQYSLMREENPGAPPEVRCQILDQLMTSKLLLNQAKLDSIEVTEDQVEEQLNARIERILSYMNGDINQFEEYYGQTITQVKDQFREDLRSQLLIDRMRGDVLRSVRVTPSEVKAFFEAIPRDSLPYFNSEVEIGEIVIKPEPSKEEKLSSFERLKEFRRQILAEEATFEELAQRYSDDGSGRLGGDLGWAKRGKFVTDFEAAAYNLEPGELSPVTETEFGYHLIQLLERRGNSIHVRHILIRPDISDDDVELSRNHLDSIRQLVLDDSTSFSRAVKRYGNEDVQSYNNDGRMLNPATNNTFFEIGDLEPDIYFTIDTMQVGGLSEPIEFNNPLGEPMLRIIQLQSRTSPHRANLKQDYSKIRKATEQSKQNDYLNEWIEEKVAATYVSLDGRFQGCPNLSKWQSTEQTVGLPSNAGDRP